MLFFMIPKLNIATFAFTELFVAIRTYVRRRPWFSCFGDDFVLMKTYVVVLGC